MKRESAFQNALIRTIKNLLPGCIVLKLDPNYIQGIPDLLVLHGVTWAALECKRTEDAHHQPNQDYYIDKMSSMSFASFIYPENMQQVLKDMINHFDRINNKDLTYDEFMELKDSEVNLQSILSTNNYIEATGYN